MAGYSINLADGQSWELNADPRSTQWLKKLSSITGIRHNGKNPGSRSFCICRKSSSSSSPNLPGDDWTAQGCGPVEILFSQEDRKTIFELREESTVVSDYISMFNIIHFLYDQAQGLGALPLHAALIEFNGRGAAIAAPSGTGKSTCARRIPPPWKALCDDETLIVRDGHGIYHAHPFPTWSEYILQKTEPSWKIEHHIPLKGLFFLVRSENDAVIPIPPEKAAKLIYSSVSQVYDKVWSTWSRMSPEREFKAKSEAFGNACHMARSLPAYLLKASLDGKFWEHIEKALDP